jgi:hypothetical protein
MEIIVYTENLTSFEGVFSFGSASVYPPVNKTIGLIQNQTSFFNHDDSLVYVHFHVLRDFIAALHRISVCGDFLIRSVMMFRLVSGCSEKLKV